MFSTPWAGNKQRIAGKIISCNMRPQSFVDPNAQHMFDIQLFFSAIQLGLSAIQPSGFYFGFANRLGNKRVKVV